MIEIQEAWGRTVLGHGGGPNGQKVCEVPTLPNSRSLIKRRDVKKKNNTSKTDGLDGWISGKGGTAMTGAGKLLMSRSDGWPGTGSALGCRVSLSSTRLQVAQALDSPPCWWSSSRYEIWTPHLLSNFILVKSDPKEVSQSSRWTFQSVLLTRLGSANRADHISNGRVHLTRFHNTGWLHVLLIKG